VRLSNVFQRFGAKRHKYLIFNSREARGRRAANNKADPLQTKTMPERFGAKRHKYLIFNSREACGRRAANNKATDPLQTNDA
jgi:hypothetical protein